MRFGPLPKELVNEEVEVYDLENDIQRCWTIVDDINEFLDARDKMGLSEDQQLNYLIGLVTIYNIRFAKLNETFEKVYFKKKE